MISIEKEGFEQAIQKFAHLSDNWQQVIEFATKRTVVVLSELLDIRSEYLIPIRVEEGDKRVWYGLSVEPEPFQDQIENLEKEKILFLQVNKSEAENKLVKAAKGNPWLQSLVPQLPDEDGELGFVYLRDSAEDEREKIKERNLDYLNKIDQAPIGDPKATALFQEDVQYNVARAEFGIGPEMKRRRWRPALKELFQKEMQIVLNDVACVIKNGEIPDVEIEFEDRTRLWLRENREFMLRLA